MFLEDPALDPRLPDRVTFIATSYLGGLPTHLQVPTMVPVHATATCRDHAAGSLGFPHARLLMIRGRLMTYTNDIINKEVVQTGNSGRKISRGRRRSLTVAS